MKAQDFLAWMDAVGIKTATDVGRTLGLSREWSRRYVVAAKAGEEVDMKLSTRLAMTALANGLRPWDEYER